MSTSLKTKKHPSRKKTPLALPPNPRNPRVISPAQRTALARSLREFGDLSGVILNVRSGRLIGGHQRVTAFEAGAPTLHIEHRFDPPSARGTTASGHILIDGERHTYREVDWPEPREHAAMIAANTHGGAFDTDALAELASELEGQGFDKELLGLLEETGNGDGELAKLVPAAPVKKVQCPKCGKKFVP